MSEPAAEIVHRIGKLLRSALAAAVALLACGCTIAVSRTPPATPQVPDPGRSEQSPYSVTGHPTPSSTPTRPPTPTLQSSQPSVVRLAVTVVVPTATPEARCAQCPPERIAIPAVALEAPVVPLGWTVETTETGLTSRWEELPPGAAGWHLNSAYPGQGSNVVLSGHHNIAGEVFRDLATLRPGDEIVLSAGGLKFHYRVTERIIVPESQAPPEQRLHNASWMGPTATERLTLITCWPHESNTHRVIVIAQPEVAEASRLASR